MGEKESAPLHSQISLTTGNWPLATLPLCRVPHTSRFSMCGKDWFENAIELIMRSRDARTGHYGHGDLHYITSSCFHRRSLLGSAETRDLFLSVLEQVRRHYVFDVIAYVVMPEHFHLLISEPQRRDPSVVMKILQTVSRKLLPRTGGPSFICIPTSRCCGCPVLREAVFCGAKGG